jgi:hypothetical protein
MQLATNHRARTEPDVLRLEPPFREILAAWLKIGALLAICGFAGATIAIYPKERHFFLWQDLPMLVVCIGVVWGAGLAMRQAQPVSRPVPLEWPLVLGLAFVCATLGAIGARFVLNDYVLSLDEFLANLDAQIFAQGKLMAPVDPAWRPFEPALQPMYMLPVASGDVWASSYLPINAAMRALGSKAGVEWLVNPALSAFAVAAAYGVGRQIWPADRDRATATIAAALLGTSPQLIVMSMTAYAMPGHLAFNLAWLWLFLRGGKAGHAGALLVGFLATGLHQFLFHPLFAAPFILDLWISRRWRLAALYTIAYALIVLFWIEFWPLEMRLLGERVANAGVLGTGPFWWRVKRVLALASPQNFALMAESLMRFVTWQNPLTAPLALLGAFAALRARSVMRNLAFGIVLTLLAMLILEPTQSNGWGYRYLHGLLGSVCLIAAWTWVSLTARLSPPAVRAAGLGLAFICAASLLVLTPLRTWQTWSYVRPYSIAAAEIEAARAPIVIVDHEGQHGFDPGTLVRNDPFLREGPKVMELSYMDDDMIRRACARGPVKVFSGHDALAAGIDTSPLSTEPEVAKLRALMAQLKCGVPVG